MTVPPVNPVQYSWWGARSRVPPQDMVEVQRIHSKIDRSRNGAERCINNRLDVMQREAQGSKTYSKWVWRSAMWRIQQINLCECFPHQDEGITSDPEPGSSSSLFHNEEAAGRCVSVISFSKYLTLLDFASNSKVTFH